MGKKIIFFFAWIGIFLLSIIGVMYVAVPDFFVQFNEKFGSVGADILILAVSILYLALSVYRFFSLFTRNKDYAIKTENGTVYISPNTVSTFVKNDLSGDKDISNIKVDAKKSGNKFNIIINLEVLNDDNISEKLGFVQGKVKNDLAQKFGINVGKVEVKISKIIPPPNNA